MAKKLTTYYTNDDSGYCEVHFDFKDERAYIEYFDNTGKMFYTEYFPDHSLHYVHDAAENWALGIKKLEEKYG